MPFPLEHWRNPRGTIACSHQHDDMAYMLHGAQMAAYALRYLGLPLGKVADLTCLDYGCGTGRIARVLASYFKHVHAYDPQPACMEAARKECPAIPIRNLTIGLPDRADVAVCVNVLEHLDTDRAAAALADMTARCPVSVVWYAPKANAEAIAPYIPAEQLRQAQAAGGRVYITVIRR